MTRNMDWQDLLIFAILLTIGIVGTILVVLLNYY